MVTGNVGRILAVDWGEKRIGLAVSDPMRMIASPAGFILRRPRKRPPVARLIARAEELGASEVLFGLPLDGNGDETPRSQEVREIAAEVAKRTGWPVAFADERFTTAEARRAVRELGGKPEDRPGDIDALSATVLLQNVLGRHGK